MTRTSQSIEDRTIPIKLSTAFLIIMSTITTEASMMGIYYSIKEEIKDVKTQQNIQTQIDNIRFDQIENTQREDHELLKSLASRVNILEHERSSYVVDNNQGKQHE